MTDRTAPTGAMRSRPQKSRAARSLLSTTLIAAALLAGCSDSQSGTPSAAGKPLTDSPASNVSTPSSSTDHSSDAPRVAEPLDVATLEHDPCAVLSQAQVSKRDLQPGKVEPVDGAPACEYTYTDGSGSQVSFVQVPAFKTGLSDIYARKANLALFEPAERNHRASTFVSLSVRLTPA